MELDKEVNPRFEDFLFDWDYTTYLLVGGYGSSKSYHIALKIVLKCLQEKRKVLVIREVYDTMRESCFDLLEEILDELDAGRNILPLNATMSPYSQTGFNGTNIPFAVTTIP